jgi:NTP pyrophosphatase (non-canonical NTP hydrolase)
VESGLQSRPGVDTIGSSLVGAAMHPFDLLTSRLSDFVAAREWRQFHTPRDMAMCLNVEAAELLELFLWTREGPGPHPAGAAPPSKAPLEEEAADVLISLLGFCDVAGIDLLDATARKLTALEDKYPVEHARGSAVKMDRRSPWT